MNIETHCAVCLEPIEGEYVTGTWEPEGGDAVRFKVCKECATPTTPRQRNALIYYPAENIEKLLDAEP